jgi:hypothetical protein
VLPRAGADVFPGAGLTLGEGDSPDVELPDALLEGRGAKVGAAVGRAVGEGVGVGIRVGVACAAVSKGIPNRDALEAPIPPPASATDRPAPSTTTRLTKSVRFRRHTAASLL